MAGGERNEERERRERPHPPYASTCMQGRQGRGRRNFSLSHKDKEGRDKEGEEKKQGGDKKGWHCALKWRRGYSFIPYARMCAHRREEREGIGENRRKRKKMDNEVFSPPYTHTEQGRKEEREERVTRRGKRGRERDCERMPLSSLFSKKSRKISTSPEK